MADGFPHDYPGRLARLQRKLIGADLSGAYITAGSNMRYFVGWSAFDGGWPVWLSALVIPADGAPGLLMSRMHYDILQRSDSWLKHSDVRVHRDGEVPTGDLLAILSERRMLSGRIGVEDSMWYGDSVLLRTVDSAVRLEPLTPIINALRQIKEPSEIEAIRKSNEITVAGYERAAEVIREGVPEYEAAVAVAQAMVAAGSETMELRGSFRRLTQRRFQAYDIVDVDIGARWRGYGTDTARNMFVGRPDAAAERVYRVTLEAFQGIMERIKPGVALQELHRFAVGYLKRHGCDQVWKVGHGVGLAHGHEAPLVQEGETQAAQPNMVFAVDPGCFVENQTRDLPIHIEDCVLVTDSGCESLTNFRHDLIVV